eukprot:55979_1
MTVSTSSSLIDLVTHDWKQINLPSLRSELDEKLLHFDTLSNDNKLERKELSKQTKSLKKCKKEEKLKKFGSVLKLYQKHIDHKDKECKFIFESFLKIYRILSEAPDPIDALQNGQIQILKLQKQLLDYKDMKIKLKNYENEFNDLKNQDITVKTLKEEIKKMESEQTNKINLELAKQEEAFAAQMKVKLNEKDTKYNECKSQLKQLQDEVIDLQHKLDEQQNHLLSQSLSTQNNNEIEEATQHMLEDELDRANITIARLTKERDELKIAKQAQANATHHQSNEEIREFEINTLKKRLAESNETNHTLQKELDTANKQHHKFKEEQQSIALKRNQNIEKMRDKMQRLPNEKEYTLLKQKVTLLQQEFLSKDSYEDSLSVNVSMETLFNTKFQSLQSELTGLKLDLHSKNNELLTYKNDYRDIKQQHEEQKLLITKLENDLSQRLQVGVDHEEKKVNEKEDAIIQIKNQKDEYSVMDLPSKQVSDEDDVGKDKEDNAAFLIVCDQRDRFRIKLQKTEQIKLRLESKVDHISSENAQLKQENVALYSKIKFLENYQSVKRTHAMNVNVITNRRGKSSEEIEMKYEDLYEQSINPFAEFRKREKETRINSLDWTEWIAFVVGSTVLSKRVFRLFGVFYAIALHLLIFFTILHEYYSHTMHCNEQPPGIQIDLPPNVIIEDHGIPLLGGEPG